MTLPKQLNRPRYSLKKSKGHGASYQRYFAALLFALAGLAQATAPVYQVELIAFEYKDTHVTGQTREEWPQDIVLAYPPNLTQLRSSAQNNSNTIHDSENSETNNLPNATEHEEKTDQNSDAFTLLPNSLKKLTNTSKKLQSNPKFRVLFHEAWQQPLSKSAEATSIVISGGNTFGAHHELEGSIQISLSRYLHINADLWLTQFVANYGQDLPFWPPLPRKPSLVIDNPSVTPSISHQNTQLSELRGTSRISKASQEEPSNDNTFFGRKLGLSNLNTDYKNISDTPYLIKNIATLKQQRRMRGGELHYIDHPKVGLLIHMELAEQEDSLSLNN